jgi:hypothetical protein
MGGIGGSTLSALCYIAFDYIGPVPEDPPGGTSTAPAAVAGLSLQGSGANVVLSWDPVDTDVDGNAISVARYAIYRGSAPDFVPDRNSKLNRIGLVSDTSFTDLNALVFAEDMYYRVTAERLDGTESVDESALGIRRRISMAPNGSEPLTTWIGLPGNHSAQSASELVAEMNGGTGQGAVTRLSRIDPATQQRQSWQWDGSSWNGTDFALQAGEAYEVVVGTTLGWNSIGVEPDSTSYSFQHHTSISNLNWIALPWTAAYGDAQSLVDAMNGGTAASSITKVARVDPSSGALQSLVFFKGGWRGSNFPIEPGVGVLVLVGSDLPAWSPTLH